MDSKGESERAVMQSLVCCCVDAKIQWLALELVAVGGYCEGCRPGVEYDTLTRSARIPWEHGTSVMPLSLRGCLNHATLHGTIPLLV